MSNQKLAEELHKPIIRTFKKWKKYNLLNTIFGQYKDNIRVSRYAINSQI